MGKRWRKRRQDIGSKRRGRRRGFVVWGVSLPSVLGVWRRSVSHRLQKICFKFYAEIMHFCAKFLFCYKNVFSHPALWIRHWLSNVDDVTVCDRPADAEGRTGRGCCGHSPVGSSERLRGSAAWATVHLVQRLNTTHSSTDVEWRASLWHQHSVKQCQHGWTLGQLSVPTQIDPDAVQRRRLGLHRVPRRRRQRLRFQLHFTATRSSQYVYKIQRRRLPILVFISYLVILHSGQVS